MHAIAEMKQTFLLKIHKPNVAVENVPFPLYIDLLNEESKCVISLLYQFLGLDSDQFFLETLLSLLFRLSLHQLEYEAGQYFFLKFNELQDENINLHLVNFHMTRHFRFQSYLVRMF